jgi:outer membrane protein assembly complex protein YaeT
MIIRRSITCFLLAAGCAVAETRIRVSGLERKTEGQVLDLIGERMVHVRRKNASPSRADDAAFLLRQLLRKDGYAQAEVSWRIVNPQEINLIVREGPRLSLGDVTIEGVSGAQNKKLVRLFQRPAEKDRPIGSGPAPFREEDVGTGLSYLRQELHAQGFWAAEAEEISRETDAATGDVDLSIRVRPGELHRIGKPVVRSGDGRGVMRTTTTVEPFIGKSATTANLNEMRLAVEEAFISRGYPDAKIRISRTIATPSYIPGISIDLGVRVKLLNVRVEGLERTSPDRVLRRFKKLEDEWYDEAAMNKQLRGLLASGAFSSVRAETVEVSNKRIDAMLHFDEARAKEVSLAAGFGSYQGLITRASYTDRNLFGQLLGFSTGLELSSRGVLGETRLTDPWFLGHDLTATARAYALIYGREGYETFDTGIEGSLTWKFGDHYTLDVLAGYSLVNTTGSGLADADLGETSYLNPKLRVTQMLDYRDSPVLPKSGWHLTAPLEIGAATGDISTTYLKAGLSGGWYHRINANHQLALGGAFGMIIPSGDGADLPIDLRYFNGGARSVRSFPERELGPLSANGYATGGEAMWTTNAELTRNIAGALKATAFFDAGTLAREFDSLGSAEIEMAVGLGLRLDLPIGPIRLEYGHNLTKDTGEPEGTFHFAIGTAF